MADITLEEKVKRLIKEHSKGFKTQGDISSFSAMITKHLIETALNEEV